MTENEVSEWDQSQTLAAVQLALRLVCVELPHLAGLAHIVRIRADKRVPTIGVFPSGLLAVNPGWFMELKRPEAAYVVAHELLHLALQTHQRAPGTDPRLFNTAHDYIINDMLTEALHIPPPAHGLAWPGARLRSAESIASELRHGAASEDDLRTWSWSDSESGPAPDTAMTRALRQAGLDLPLDTGGSDVLPGELQREWYPELDPAEERRISERVRDVSDRAASLEQLWEKLDRAAREHAKASVGASGPENRTVQALEALYRPPWEMALQRWMEAVAPGPRSYARPSRRGADRTDVVLAGRIREGWTLHIVLDTSGSMEDEFGRILGAIGSFCAGVNVAEVHLLQCDEDVTGDERLAPEELRQYRVEGLGGSDMSPAMHHLSKDSEVEAAIVITDGAIIYPDEPMPYGVLWVLTGENDDFRPEYGQVITLA